mmetsp:Transcript_77040/g.133306  ORF Transcript_77040/g.133306 Transcript_77040/m.133306 type:complete len:196 (+) Transcript_77040:78-665(+)
MASDGGLPAAMSLVDVAVRAAVLAGAPRRTVAATAAAVASVVMAELRGVASARGETSCPPSVSKRRRMKRKKQAEKKKLATSASLHQPALSDGAAGCNEDSGEVLVSAPAPAPDPLAATAPPAKRSRGDNVTFNDADAVIEDAESCRSFSVASSAVRERTRSPFDGPHRSSAAATEVTSVGHNKAQGRGRGRGRH